VSSGAHRYTAGAARSSRTSFYYSFLLLPREKRRAIYAIYAFCRATDDVADGPGDPAAKARELGEWGEELARCYAGEPRHPITEELLHAVRRYALPREHFEGILEGIRSDLTRRRYESFEDLRQYCHRVASLVGLLCVEVFGYREPGSRDYARELGLAFQLTNILRDVGADAGAGRIYVPKEDLVRFGVTEEEILARRFTAAFRELMAFQVARARERYVLAESLLPAPDRRDLFAARIMAGIYQRVLTEIERMGYDVLHLQAGVGTARKIGIALRVYLADRAFSPPHGTAGSVR
jgi:phytoene synthase